MFGYNSIMEAQIADIKENTIKESLNQFKVCILDCTRNIKSNDDSFGISTFPVVKGKLDDSMEDYHRILKNIEASRAAFLSTYEAIDGKEVEEYVDLENFINEFQKKIDDELNKSGAAEPEEEILFENPQTHPKDPITRQNIKFAIKSNVCGHIYDKEVILNYFQQRKNKTVKCPQAGCANKKMNVEELVDDEETNILIQSL